MLSLLGCNLLSGGETALSCCVRTVAAHALVRLFTDHHRARSAVTGLYTVRALCTVIRRAALETGGLIPWCQPTCPVCQWQAALFDLGAPGPATALNASSWRGEPQGASSRRHAAGPAPIPPQDGTWQRRTPSRGEGGPGRQGQSERAGLRWGGPSHVAPPDLPEETGSTRATRGLFQPSWGREAP
jgi:hypothetical protein